MIAVFPPLDCSILFQNRAKYCTKKLIKAQNACSIHRKSMFV